MLTVWFLYIKRTHTATAAFVLNHFSVYVILHPAPCCYPPGKQFDCLAAHYVFTLTFFLPVERALSLSARSQLNSIYHSILKCHVSYVLLSFVDCRVLWIIIDQLIDFADVEQQIVLCTSLCKIVDFVPIWTLIAFWNAADDRDVISIFRVLVISWSAVMVEQVEEEEAEHTALGCQREHFCNILIWFKKEETVIKQNQIWWSDFL